MIQIQYPKIKSLYAYNEQIEKEIRGTILFTILQKD
jgi:hypothetical protein